MFFGVCNSGAAAAAAAAAAAIVTAECVVLVVVAQRSTKWDIVGGAAKGTPQEIHPLSFPMLKELGGKKIKRHEILRPQKEKHDLSPHSPNFLLNNQASAEGSETEFWRERFRLGR
ncbi:hypothetical protein CCMA1212_002203 [Trichoderma ghanense]|uniref:Secreted protein n=1 Tax=Trichoderma ghanense TaxID=65468 RepID=A0ABY2HER0_9HYPO